MSEAIFTGTPSGFDVAINSIYLHLIRKPSFGREIHIVVPLSKIEKIEWTKEKVKINDEEFVMGKFTEEFVNALIPLLK